MSYPQPNADQYAIKGYQFFRLNTLLTSPGDIYESVQSGHGVCIGPESDLAQINVAYFDDQVPTTFMQRTQISPTRGFLGRVDARNDVAYAPANRTAKILFWSADIYDPNYRPVSLPAKFAPDTDAIQFVAPRLDVIEYFRPVHPGAHGRNDRAFTFQNYPLLLGGGRFFLVVPYYGRKYAHVEITNRDNVTATNFGIVGLNYAITQDDSPTPYHQETTLFAETAVGPGSKVNRIISSGVDGMFDALVVSLTQPGPAPLRILVSDTPAVDL